MEAISIGSDPRFYFQVGKMKISEGIKCLQDLVEWCKYNLSPENGGILHETMAFLQSLHQQVQEIESGAQQGGAPGSFNVYGTHLQCGQEITQIREQNANFETTLNQEVKIVMNQKGHNSSCSKRKRWSKFWEHYTKYADKDGKEWAKCKHCKKDFVGSSKSGTTHLNNHLKSCPSLRNPNKVTNKAREKNVIDQELNDFNWVKKVLRYGLNIIKDDILEVYEQEKNKLHRYLDDFPGHFNVSIKRVLCDLDVWYVMVWFIDDNWKLKKRIIHLEMNDIGDVNEHFLKCLIKDLNIDKRILSLVNYCDTSKDTVLQLTNWLKERASPPFIGICDDYFYLEEVLQFEVEASLLKSDIMIKMGKFRDHYMTSSNKFKFELAVKKVESLGKKVTYKHDFWNFKDFHLLDWAMGHKELFCELEHIDPDFKSIKFDWEDATVLHNVRAVLKDLENDVYKLEDSDFKLANECFPMVYQTFIKMLQFKNTENHYFRLAVLLWREFFDEYCKNSKLVLVITVILDPRFKQDIVQHFYEEIYDSEAEDLHFKKIMDDVTNIYNEYAKDVNNSSVVRAYAFPQQANEAASSKSELDHYLTDSKVPPHDDFDILEWWRLNSSAYPTLATMARDFLSIPFVGGDHDNLLEEDVEVICSNWDVDIKRLLACTQVWLIDPESRSC